MNILIGLISVAVGAWLVWFTFKNPADEKNNPLNADFAGYLSGLMFFCVGIAFIIGKLKL